MGWLWGAFLLLALPLCANGDDVAGCGMPCIPGKRDCSNSHCSLCAATVDGKRYCVRGQGPGELCSKTKDCYGPGTKGGKQLKCDAHTKDGLKLKVCTPTDSTKNAAIGYLGAAVAILFFGSSFVPVKKFDTGDGVFFQWNMCIMIFLVGLIVNCVRGSPQFHPYSMLGGALWCTGNIMVVPTVRTVGLALGMCIWGSTNMVFGWASGTFGLFGVTKETVAHPALNYCGVVCVLIATGFFSAIKPADAGGEGESLSEEGGSTESTEEDSLMHKPRNPESGEYGVQDHDASDAAEPDFIDKMPAKTKRMVGLVLALVQGVFYGINFDPPTHQMDNFIELEETTGVNFSNQGLDYVFSQFCGILLTSTVYMIIYGGFKRNQPWTNPKAILPGLLSGAMWACAQTGWFVANQNLSLAVAFPLITVGPGLVSSLWGVIAFKEIQGRRNFILLGFAFLMVVTAATLITLSN